MIQQCDVHQFTFQVNLSQTSSQSAVYINNKINVSASSTPPLKHLNMSIYNVWLCLQHDGNCSLTPFPTASITYTGQQESSDQGHGLGLHVSVSRRSADVSTSRLDKKMTTSRSRDTDIWALSRSQLFTSPAQVIIFDQILQATLIIFEVDSML